MADESNEINIIGKGTEITGDIKTTRDMRIDGFHKGNVITQGKLVIGEHGKIKGEIQCKNSEVMGTIDGKIMVKELLSLKSSAKLFGDMDTQKLAVEPGSYFSGKCTMNSDRLSSEVAIGKQKNKKERKP